MRMPGTQMAHVTGNPRRRLLWHCSCLQKPFGVKQLRSVWLVLMNETGPVHVCTDSWAVYRDLTLWLPWWAAQEWMIGHRPYGARGCGKTSESGVFSRGPSYTMSPAISRYRPQAVMQPMRWHNFTSPVYCWFWRTLALGSAKSWGM